MIQSADVRASNINEIVWGLDPIVSYKIGTGGFIHVSTETGREFLLTSNKTYEYADDGSLVEVARPEPKPYESVENVPCKQAEDVPYEQADVSFEDLISTSYLERQEERDSVRERRNTNRLRNHRDLQMKKAVARRKAEYNLRGNGGDTETRRVSKLMENRWNGNTSLTPIGGDFDLQDIVSPETRERLDYIGKLIRREIHSTGGMNVNGERVISTADGRIFMIEGDSPYELDTTTLTEIRDTLLSNSATSRLNGSLDYGNERRPVNKKLSVYGLIDAMVDVALGDTNASDYRYDNSPKTYSRVLRRTERIRKKQGVSAALEHVARYVIGETVTAAPELVETKIPAEHLEEALISVVRGHTCACDYEHNGFGEKIAWLRDIELALASFGGRRVAGILEEYLNQLDVGNGYQNDGGRFGTRPRVSMNRLVTGPKTSIGGKVMSFEGGNFSSSREPAISITSVRTFAGYVLVMSASANAAGSRYAARR